MSSIVVGSQISSKGVYVHYGAFHEIEIKNTRFTFKPSVDYLHHTTGSYSLFQRSHLRIGAINTTYSVNRISFDFTSGTLLPVPRIVNPTDWGYQVFYSFKIERLYKRFTTYVFYDLYRTGPPLFKMGVYYQLFNTDKL